jgi:hypothetical protein
MRNEQKSESREPFMKRFRANLDPQAAPLAVALLMLGTVPGKAQSWQTVLDYQMVPGASSGANCIITDPLGSVFNGGVGYPASGFGSGVVLKTDSTEADCYKSDNSNPNPPAYGSEVNGMAIDSSGNLYSSGTFYSPCTQTSCPGSQWYIRASSDSGATWSTVNLFQYVAGKNCGAGAMSADLSGNVYVVGTAADASGVGHWLVRRGSDGGTTWSSVDDISGARALGIGFVPNAGLFAMGSISTVTSSKNKTTTTSPWVVRRSFDGGATWTTVDVLQPPSGYTASGQGIAADAQGNLYVAGRTTILVTSGHATTAMGQWIVRKSSDGGNTWATVDAFSYVPGKASVAFGIGNDPTRNVVVVGTGTDSAGYQHWLVRRPDSSGQWQTIDDYQLVAGKSAEAGGVASDAAGHLLVTGAANDAAGVMHWIVRRL